jgi:Flp pilus assembly pilin Flp
VLSLQILILSTMSSLRDTLQRPSRGQSMVEYALIIGLVAIGAFLVIGLLGGQLGNTFNAIISKLQSTPANGG